MFHGRPLNQPTSQNIQPQPTWPLNQNDFNNLRQSQNIQPRPIPVKIYLPDDEIRRTSIDSSYNLEKIHKKVKNYASVSGKDIVLAWRDSENEWIRFDTEEEFAEALSTSGQYLLKIQAKEKKQEAKVETKQTSPIKTETKPIDQPVQQPVQPPQQPVQQPVPVQPQLQPTPVQQPQIQPTPQPRMTQPVQQPVQPSLQPFKFIPTQPPMMTMGTLPQTFSTPNQPPFNVPVVQPPSQASMIVPVQPKSLSNSVTLVQPHPLNTPTQSPIKEVSSDLITYQSQLEFLRGLGFSVSDADLIQILKECNGQVEQATERLLAQQFQ